MTAAVAAGAATRTSRAALVVDSKCTLGEGATWCAKTGRFYWTDIEGARLWRYDPADGRSTSWAMPERVATFALCADPHYLLLGLASRLAFFDLATGGSSIQKKKHRSITPSTLPSRI